MTPQQCPGNNLRCPNPDCGKPLGVPMLHVRNGDGFLVCPHKIGAYTERRNCNQNVFWYCTAHLCSVLAITREQYKQVRALDSVEAILAALGLSVVEAA
jgi:hypothetical protein